MLDRDTNQSKNPLSPNGPLAILIDMLHILPHISLSNRHLSILADVTGRTWKKRPPQ